MLLPVSAPFHCALMQPAADAMAEALAKVTVKPPRVPLVANVLAAPISDPAEIVRALVAQVTGTVRWREIVAFMAASRRDDVLRSRRRQGAVRTRQAHRRTARAVCRSARRRMSRRSRRRRG